MLIDQIDRGMSTFKSIRDAVPEYLPLTPAQQDEFGHKNDYSIEKQHVLGWQAVLCLPNTPMCKAWSAWAETNRALPPGAGFMMMNSDIYSQRFTDLRSRPYPHTAEDQELSVHAIGKPLMNWQFKVGVMED